MPAENRAGRTPAALQRKLAAAHCGVSVDSFDRHIRPHVTCRYVGGVRVWLVADLNRFLEESE